MLSLTTLAAQEVRLIERLSAIRGSREQRAALIGAAGLDIAYRAILRGYLSLAEVPASSLEAVKRAAFLAWRAISESPESRAFGAITLDQIDGVLLCIDRLRSERRDDNELWAILAHCHAMVPTMFKRLTPESALRLLIESSARDDHFSRVQIPSDPWERGYLGIVFAARRC